MPTREEINNKIDSLPEELRDALYSPDLLEKLATITDSHHFDEEKLRLTAGALLRLFTGYIHPEDLAKEITSRLQIDKRIAEDVAKEIKTKLLYPVAELLNKTHGFHIEGAPKPTPQLVASAQPPAQLPAQPQPTTTPNVVGPPAVGAQPPLSVLTPNPSPQEEVLMKPRIQEGSFSEQLPTPLVLHEHEDIEATDKKTTQYAGGLARPSFHVPDDYGARAEEYTEPAPAARLELGGQAGSVASTEPRTARVGKEEATVVHYTAPVVETDPFFGTTPATPTPPKPTAPPATTKPSIPRDNVINLKDLPK